MCYPPIKHMIIGSTYVIVQLISITTPAITTCLMSILGKRLLILALINYFTRALMDLEKSNIFYIVLATLYSKWIGLDSLIQFSKFCKFICYLCAKIKHNLSFFKHIVHGINSERRYLSRRWYKVVVTYKLNNSTPTRRWMDLCLFLACLYFVEYKSIHHHSY